MGLSDFGDEQSLGSESFDLASQLNDSRFESVSLDQLNGFYTDADDDLDVPAFMRRPSRSEPPKPH